MSSFLSRLASSPLLIASLLMTLAAPLAAQQKVCLSVHQQDPLIPAAGVDLWGMPSKVSTRVGGIWITRTSPARVTRTPRSARTTKTRCRLPVSRPNASMTREFCITKAPNGADITKGVVYEITDPNLGMDVKVHKNETISDPTTKDNGVLVGLPLSSQPPVSFGAAIDAHLIVVDSAGTLLTTLVVVSIPPLSSGVLLQAEIREQFELAGFFGNIVLVEDRPTPRAWSKCCNSSALPLVLRSLASKSTGTTTAGS